MEAAADRVNPSKSLAFPFAPAFLLAPMVILLHECGHYIGLMSDEGAALGPVLVTFRTGRAVAP